MNLIDCVAPSVGYRRVTKRKTQAPFALEFAQNAPIGRTLRYSESEARAISGVPPGGGVLNFASVSANAFDGDRDLSVLLDSVAEQPQMLA